MKNVSLKFTIHANDVFRLGWLREDNLPIKYQAINAKPKYHCLNFAASS
jgi:hypothetical protein